MRLYLYIRVNIYILLFQKPSKSGYPVLLFIHGGSNDVGMGAMFDGDVIAGFSEIIVITFNYRLGALGKLVLLLYPHCPDLLENLPRHENSTSELL